MAINVNGFITWLRTFLDDVYAPIGQGGNISLDDVYPIGAIYMSVSNTSPSTLFGGTWVQIKDTFLLACGDTYVSDGDVATAQHGEASHTLNSDEMPSHTHTQNAHNHTQAGHSHGTGNTTNKYFLATNNTSIYSSDSKKQISNGSTNYVVYSTSADTNVGKYTATDSKTPTINDKTATNQNTGGGQAHNNMPPYMSVYVWKRTA